MEIRTEAPPAIADFIRSFGRTEDLRFSPDCRRLAIAEAGHNRIAILDVDIASSSGPAIVRLTGAAEIASPSLAYPHGLDFIDERTLVVGNRRGGVAIFELPAGAPVPRRHELSPVHALAGGKGEFLGQPASLSIVRANGDARDLLVCNNHRNRITRHRIERGHSCALSGGEVLLSKWLNLPDGISVSGDGRWIAVSNHNTRNVLLYDTARGLNAESGPDGILRWVFAPHGVRFSPDGRYLFVADAGAPYVHVYAGDGRDWRGARNPAASVRVMDEATFARGRSNAHEGGPKGIDIDSGMNVLAASSEHQPLAFFDLPAIVSEIQPAPTLDVRHELDVLEDTKVNLDYVRQLEARLREAEVRAGRAEAKTARLKSLLAKAEARVGFPVGRWLRRAIRPLRRP